MSELLKRWWRDEPGTVGTEWAFVATILVLGTLTGLIAVRQSALAKVERPAQVARP